MQSLPLAVLLARSTFGGLWSRNCHKGGHGLWSTCPTGGLVLQLDMYYWRHVLREDMSRGVHVLQDDIFLEK